MLELFQNKRIKGAISIFLIIISVPAMLFASILVDASRYNSAKAIAQEATDLAALSVLSAYDQELKDEYGLMAFDSGADLETLFKSSLEASLLASGIDVEEDYSEKLWEIMKEAVGAGSPYDGASFFDLYDFQLDEGGNSVTPVYSLAEWQVLENQMVEYSKFRGLYVAFDRLSILNSLSDLKSEAEDQAETVEVMEDKMSVDEDNSSVETDLSDLRDSIFVLNGASTAMLPMEDGYLKALECKMKEIAASYIDDEEAIELTDEEKDRAGEYDDYREDLVNELKEIDDKALDVIKKAEKARASVEAAITRLEGFISENEALAGDNETVSALIDEGNENIRQYKEIYIPQIDGIINEPILNKLSRDNTLPINEEKFLEDIDKAIHRYGEEIDEDEEESEIETLITEYYFYYTQGDGRTDDINSVIYDGSPFSYRVYITNATEYFSGKTWEEINPALNIASATAGASGSSDYEEVDDFAQEQSNSSPENELEDPNTNERKEVPEDIYNSRPSVTFSSEGDASTDVVDYNKDGDISSIKSAIGGSSMFSQILEPMRDDLLCLSYMLGTFKTRLTGVEKFSSEGMSQADKDSFYMPEWRYAHEGGELDMRFSPKKERETVLRAEIEYLIFGNRTDAANEIAAYAAIYAERYLNNIVAVYSHPQIRASCNAMAGAASLATAGFVPQPIFKWIFIGAWAAAETAMDMTYLIEGGYKIPAFKTRNNVLLTLTPTFVDREGSSFSLINNYKQSGIFISYEDYLLLMLLLSGQEKRLMRSADLIEMNMKHFDPEFTMSGAYTYIDAGSKISAKYLFSSVAPFASTYERGGLSGRMEISSDIFLGY